MCLFHTFCALLCVLSSFAISLKGEKELGALICLSSWCLVNIVFLWLLLMLLWVGMQFVIVAFPDRTH